MEGKGRVSRGWTIEFGDTVNIRVVSVGRTAWCRRICESGL